LSADSRNASYKLYKKGHIEIGWIQEDFHNIRDLESYVLVLVVTCIKIQSGKLQDWVWIPAWCALAGGPFDVFSFTRTRVEAIPQAQGFNGRRVSIKRTHFLYSHSPLIAFDLCSSRVVPRRLRLVYIHAPTAGHFPSRR
jgi:hypothetical protein